MREFDKIEGNSGTLVIIYNMKLLDSGESELDVKSDLTDILLTNPDGGDYDTDEGLVIGRFLYFKYFFFFFYPSFFSFLFFVSTNKLSPHISMIVANEYAAHWLCGVCMLMNINCLK